MNPRRLPDETVDAIVADYKAGVPTIEIADKYQVSDKTVNRYTAKAGARRQRPSQARPTHPCPDCGRLTTMTICRFCREESVALTGGRWVPRGLVRVWVPDGPAIDDNDPSATGTLGNHIRWHAKRDIRRPDCDHCSARRVGDAA